MRIFIAPPSGDLLQRADQVVRHAVCILHSSRILSAHEGGTINERAVVLVDAAEVSDALAVLISAGLRASINQTISQPDRGAPMSADYLWLSHDLIPDRDVKLARQVFRHRRCQRCKRDFMMPPGSAEWVAVFVGVFEFLALDGETNRKWLSEPCPGAR
jgi:hypothetical protein